MAKYEQGDRVVIDDEKDIYHGTGAAVIGQRDDNPDFYTVMVDPGYTDRAYHVSRLKREKTKYSIGFYTSRDRSNGKQPKVFVVPKEVFDKFKLELETLDELDGETDGVVSTAEVTD